MGKVAELWPVGLFRHNAVEQLGGGDHPGVVGELAHRAPEPKLLAPSDVVHSDRHRGRAPGAHETVAGARRGTPGVQVLALGAEPVLDQVLALVGGARAGALGAEVDVRERKGLAGQWRGLIATERVDRCRTRPAPRHLTPVRR